MPADRPTARRPVAAAPAAAKGRVAAPAGAPTTAPRGARGWFHRVPAKELAQFTSRLETLVNAGLPVVRCLRVLEAQQRPGPLKHVVEAVADDVEGGAPLSEAMAKYPQVFDRLYVNMVRAGEAGGVLGPILERLAGFARKAEAIKGQLKGALTYPILVMIFAGGVLLVAMLVVVPKFEQMFESYDTEMPAVTQLLISTSRGMVAWWWAVLLAPVLCVALFAWLLRNEGFAERVDAFRLRVPLFGQVVRKTIVARFTRTLGTLLASGVPILDALDIVRASISNRVVRGAVGDVHDAIREGQGMSATLGESGVFDDMVVNMIDVGEETGKLDGMLLRIAEDTEAELDTSITVLFKALEPMMLLVVALVVGLIAFALFSPMIRLMESFSGHS